jgi:hypothetical protein
MRSARFIALSVFVVGAVLQTSAGASAEQVSTIDVGTGEHDAAVTVTFREAANPLEFGLSSPYQEKACGPSLTDADGCGPGDSYTFFGLSGELVFYLTDHACSEPVTFLSTDSQSALIDQSNSTHWTIAWDDAGNCVTRDGDKNDLVVSVVSQAILTVENPGTGSGTVSLDFNEETTTCELGPGGSCTHTFDDVTVVTLSAVADSGSTFFGWVGGDDCSGTGTCTVTMDGHKSVTAIFNQNSTGDSASGFVPPGGTISTCTNTSSTDDTCSAITLPNTNDGANVTLLEQPGSSFRFCKGPCSNQVTNYSIECLNPENCYNDVFNPPKVILRYRTPGTSTSAEMYFLKLGESFRIRDCSRRGIANPNPCVHSRNRLGFGTNDLQVQVLVTADDPIIGKR